MDNKCFHCKEALTQIGSTVQMSKILNRETLIGKQLNLHWNCFLTVAGDDYYYALDKRVRPPIETTPCEIGMGEDCDCARCRKEPG